MVVVQNNGGKPARGRIEVSTSQLRARAPRVRRHRAVQRGPGRRRPRARAHAGGPLRRPRGRGSRRRGPDGLAEVVLLVRAHGGPVAPRRERGVTPARRDPRGVRAAALHRGHHRPAGIAAHALGGLAPLRCGDRRPPAPRPRGALQHRRTRCCCAPMSSSAWAAPISTRSRATCSRAARSPSPSCAPRISATPPSLPSWGAPSTGRASSPPPWPSFALPAAPAPGRRIGGEGHPQGARALRRRRGGARRLPRRQPPRQRLRQLRRVRPG